MIDSHTPIIIVDTETTNSIECPIVYDVGYQIATFADGVLLSRSFVNRDVFDRKDLMESAYFIEKLPQYVDDIAAGKRLLRKWCDIKNTIYVDCRRYGVRIAVAHNAAFDNRALNTTQRYITSSKYRYFLPYGVEWWDTLKMAREVLKENESYTTFCWNNEYLTKNMRIRYTAEIIYRWLSGDVNFEESHTGLEDVDIERQIFEYCINQKPDIDGKLWRD